MTRNGTFPKIGTRVWGQSDAARFERDLVAYGSLIHFLGPMYRQKPVPFPHRQSSITQQFARLNPSKFGRCIATPCVVTR